MKKQSHYAWKIQLLTGVILFGMGLYFIFFRPAFLPEDLRFVGLESLSGNEVQKIMEPWLNQKDTPVEYGK